VFLFVGHPGIVLSGIQNQNNINVLNVDGIKESFLKCPPIHLGGSAYVIVAEIPDRGIRV